MKTTKVFFSSVYSFLSNLFSQFEAEAALVGGLVRDLVQASTEAEDADGDIWDYFDPKDFDIIWYKPGCGPKDLANFLRETGLGFAIVVEEEFGVVKFKVKVQVEGESVDVDIDAVIPRLESYGDDSRRPEVEAIQAKSLKEAIKVDFKRRDFRCNALYLPLGLSIEAIILFDGLLNYGAILDPSNGGIRDITGTVYDESVIDPETGAETGETIPVRIGAKTLNWVNDPKTTTEDDPIRILRGIGFVFRKGYRFSEEAEKGLKENIGIFIQFIGTKKCSWEKIRDEFHKVFTKVRGIGISRYLRRLYDLGILEKVMPEVARMVGYDQKNSHHDKDLWWHSLGTLVTAINYYDEMSEKGLAFDQKEDPFDKNAISLREHLNSKGSKIIPRELLVWAALLHDVAKPDCQTLEEEWDDKTGELLNEEAHYFDHAKKSAELAIEILRKLHFSNAEADVVGELINTHMCLKDGEWDSEAQISDAVIRRRRRDFCPKGVDLQRLSLALILGDDKNHHLNFATDKKVKGFEKRFLNYLETREPEPDYKISGDELLRRQPNLRPGSEMGRILKEMKELYFNILPKTLWDLFLEWEIRDTLKNVPDPTHPAAIFKLGSRIVKRVDLPVVLVELLKGKELQYMEPGVWYDPNTGDRYVVK